MDSYQEDTYGERIAGVYDDLYAGVDPAALDLLQELAQGGRVLELGIGTGRVALPLKKAGVDISGVDASAAMVARLRSKPGSEQIPVAMGDFADVPVEGEYSLVFIVFNTFFALLTQAEQVRCFRNITRHLSAGGCFLIEAFFPDLGRFDRQQSLRVVNLKENEVHIDAAQLDTVNQVITSSHIMLSEGETHLYPVKLRFVWPSELDLMAQLAGLRLRNRWGSWHQDAFTEDSGKHISVYEHA